MKATFEFSGGLSDLLPRARKSPAILLEFASHQSIKHLVESLGVPHTEMGQVLVNGIAADPGSLLQPGDLVMILPARDGVEGEARFVLDNHLGQLSTYLRMLGFDCLYRNDIQDDELAEVAVSEERILLTRDRRLLMRRVITHGYCLRGTDPPQQTVEVLRRFRLFEAIKPFQRCLRCNASLNKVSKEEVLERLEPLTKKYYADFRQCPDCGQVYWKGSHYQRMLEMVEAVKQQGKAFMAGDDPQEGSRV